MMDLLLSSNHDQKKKIQHLEALVAEHQNSKQTVPKVLLLSISWQDLLIISLPMI